MKRLTGYNSFGGVYAIGMGCKNKTDTIHTVLCCLAAYEDTGLTPEICAEYRKFGDEAISKGVTFGRIVELMNADADGRLVVLPCAPGAELVRDEKSFTADHWNINLTAFREEPANKSGQQVALFSVEEAEKALAEVRDHA